MATIKKYNGSTWGNAVVRKFGTATETIQSGDTIYANGQPITTYTLKGNEEHTGTPSPQNPVMPNGTGDKTANLWSEEYTGISVNLTYVPIYVGDGQFTLSTTTPFSGQAANLFFLAGNVASGASTGVNGVWDGVSKTVTAIDGYVTICYRNATSNPEYFKTMLNTGSTAKPYEPHGYKIPISSGQQTIDIYIGDLPLLKSLDGTAVDEISNGTLTRRVDSDGSALPAPITTQITMPSIPTTDGVNSITVDTTVQPSEFTATWTGWHDSSVKEYDGSEWQ